METIIGNWIIRSEWPQGALDSEQIQKLAQDFDLTEANVSTMSLALAHPLSNDFMPLGILKRIRQLKKGSAELEKLINELRQAEKRLMRASELYSQIQVHYPAIALGIADPNVTKRSDLDHALRIVKLRSRSLARGSKKYRVHFMNEPDKRYVRDDRRSSVLHVIFDAWSAAGKTVSISTDTLTSQRRGPLVDFTNAVVTRITNPVTEISGETIWKEIKNWRHSNKYQGSKCIDL